MPDILKDPRGTNLGNVVSERYPISNLLSSGFSVTAHWIFAIKYLSTSMVLPALFSYIHINLLEDKFSDELNDLSAQFNMSKASSGITRSDSRSLRQRSTKAHATMEVFKEYVAQAETKKKQIRTTKWKLRSISAVVLLIYAGFMVAAHVRNWGLFYLIGDFIMFTLSSMIFLKALANIRKTISQLQSAFPNEKFMAHHAINFIVFISLSLVTFVLGIIYNSTRDED